MRRGITFVLAIGCAIAMAACSSGPSSPEQAQNGPSASATGSAAPPTEGKLTVWVDGTKYPAVKAIAGTFEKDNPGLEVNLVKKNFSDIGPEFTTQVPTGKGPDIIVSPHDGLGNFLRSGVIDPVELGDAKADFNPRAIAAVTQDGQTYALPYSVENLGLVRNNKLTKDTPANWEDLLAAGKKAKKKFPFVVGLGEAGNPYNLYPFQASFGAGVFKQKSDGSYTSDLTIGSKEGVSFATWLREQGKKGTGVLDTSMTSDVAKEQFIKGQSPYFLTGPWDIAAFEEAKMDVSVLPIPSAGGKPAAPFLGVQAFFMSSQSKNKLLANEFLTNYLGSKEGQLTLFRHGPGTPALTAAAEDPEVTGNALNKGFAEAGKQGLPMPSVPEMAKVFTYWGQTEAQIISGKQEPEKAWAKMTKNIQGAIDKQ